MPTFCRHNRFIERCPICSKTLPGNEPASRPARPARASRSAAGAAGRTRRTARGEGVRIRREERAADDGYRSALVPGLHASSDAGSLAQEIAFASARLHALATEPPGLYGEAARLGGQDIELATWTCFLIAYLSPLEDAEDPFEAIRAVLEGTPGLDALGRSAPALQEIPLGPRSSHEPGRGDATLIAYRQWVERSSPAGGQAEAFTGDPTWSPERRFQRLFERLALPGLDRAGRYELLVSLSRLGLYEMRADSLHLAVGPGGGADATTLAAKRVFGIGDPLLLDRRAGVLAEAASVPLEALDAALFNWAAPRRASLGVSPELADPDALQRVIDALEL